MKKQIANMITGFRVFCSIGLLLFPVRSVEFVCLYLLCGLSDMADGPVARKTGGVSEFGAKFDSVSDVVFIAVSLTKLLPVIRLPLWVWIWGGVIGVVRVGNLILGFVRMRKLIFLHTVMNKVTGLLLFLFPLALHVADIETGAVIICSVATVSAIQEGRRIRKLQQ